MEGTVLTTGTFLTPSAVPDVNWRMSGTGDFNRDGRPDILWRHLVSGQIVVWYMNGSVMTSGTFTNPPAVSDLAWRIAAVGDYNVDARPEILWRHQGSGQIVVWFMDDANLVDGEFTNPSNPSDIGWKVVGPR